MTDSGGTSSPAGTQVPADVARDFEAAERTFQTVKTRRPGDGAPSVFEFTRHLDYLLTIGYLTGKQATALFDWFNSEGMMKLPPHPGPTPGPSPTMYEILSTKIHFGTPEPVRRVIEARARAAADPSVGRRAGDPVEGEEELAADVLGFFVGLVAGVADAITSVLDGVTEVLQAGTELVHAGAQLVHELHDLVLLEP